MDLVAGSITGAEAGVESLADLRDIMARATQQHMLDVTPDDAADAVQEEESHT